MSCWPKGSHDNFQTNQTIAKNMSYSPRTDSKFPLFKITPTQDINMEQLTWCLHEAFTPTL